MSPPVPGQNRRGGRVSQRRHLGRSTWGLDLSRKFYRIIRSMKRIDLHVKVVIDLEDGENEQRLAAEICRAIEKVYGVRRAEVSNVISSTGE